MRAETRAGVVLRSPICAGVVLQKRWTAPRRADHTRAFGAFSAYGALALTAGLLTWIYSTALIVLISAEVGKVERDRQDPDPRLPHQLAAIFARRRLGQ